MIDAIEALRATCRDLGEEIRELRIKMEYMGSRIEKIEEKLKEREKKLI